MKTLTVRLPETLSAEIAAESHLRKVSKSDVVRERLRQRGSSNPPPTMWAAAGHILEEAWAAEVPDGPPVFRSPQKRRLAALIHARKLAH